MGGWAFIASLEGGEIVDHHISIITRAVLVCWDLEVPHTVEWFAGELRGCTRGGAGRPASMRGCFPGADLLIGQGWLGGVPLIRGGWCTPPENHHQSCLGFQDL